MSRERQGDARQINSRRAELCRDSPCAMVVMYGEGDSQPSECRIRQSNIENLHVNTGKQ